MKIFDSATHEVRDFEPVTPGKVGLYLCGPTVQGAPHLGHLRAALNFDVLVRWLRRQGYAVTYVRNVTDIDDKILAKSAAAGVPWWELAAHFEREFDFAYRALNTVPPTVTPHATAHIPQQIALIERLLERGHAYSDTNGNVYFSVMSLPDYGALTNQPVSELASTEDESQIDTATEAGKRDPRDFALWKAAKDDEPADAAWDAPWGRGRPGWHLECSAMSQAYLGDTFDIHGGGLDLRFPHHENEMAQSHGAGWGFARYWMHNAWLTLKGEKMSKSVGNVVGVRRLLEDWDPAVVRMSVVTTHYRTNLEYSEDSLKQAALLWDKFTSFLQQVPRSAPAGQVAPEVCNIYGDVEPDLVRQRELAAVELPDDFVAALDDDLNVPGALPALHRTLKSGKTALASGDTPAAQQAALQLRAMLDVFGLDPADPAWATPAPATQAASAAPDTTEAPNETLEALVTALLQQRADAKAQRDWDRADAIRDLLQTHVAPVVDTPAGAQCGPVTLG
ncbi:cysteine--tRNA ligase [uncultured Mobiluncus sp.]|uniref:cysteine--tRNA ligase n=1 Tax=uncultured Mobiluncus sp. TaxID=293425 RepID=UPI002804DFF7|nr:cysteine--tRNA ligase [uncultured Mobiluncus sp.]